VKPRRRDLRTLSLYLRSLVRSFRWTLLAVTAAVLLGGLLYGLTPHRQLNGERPQLLQALYAAWMAMFAQPVYSPPETWYLALVCGLYPLLGFVLIGEGIVRLSLLLVSREHGEKEWMKVMASTYRDHVVLCGLGHLGFRILGQLLAAGERVVGLEKDALGRFVADAKRTGIPVLIRDMKEDQALLDSGIEHARCIIIATNDDMANLEVALDARRMNPKIRILMRLFDQQIASKIKDAFSIEHAFSSAALAAPLVAAMSTEGRVLASFPIAGVAHMAAELVVHPHSALAGCSVAEIEAAHATRVLAHLRDGAPATEPIVKANDRLVVHAPADRMPSLAASAKPARASLT
jgi:Trk K+ transport system NAD-binding subunit